MTITRRDLRRYLGMEVAGDKFLYGQVISAPAPTVDQLALSELIDYDADPGLYRNRWIWHVTQGAERRTLEYDPDTGLVRLHRPLGSTPSAGDVVEIHRFQPNLLHQAINDGLKNCSYIDSVSVTPVANQRKYSLSSLTYLTHKRQVLEVRYEGTESGNEWRRLPESWDIEDDGGTLYLWITPPPFVTTNVSIVLRVRRSYGPLTDDTTELTLDDEWARAAVRVSLYKLLMLQVPPGKERERYKEQLIDARRDLRRQASLNVDRTPRKVNMRMAPMGPSYHASVSL